MNAAGVNDGTYIRENNMCNFFFDFDVVLFASYFWLCWRNAFIRLSSAGALSKSDGEIIRYSMTLHAANRATQWQVLINKWKQLKNVEEK